MHNNKKEEKNIRWAFVMFVGIIIGEIVYFFFGPVSWNAFIVMIAGAIWGYGLGRSHEN